MSNCGRLTDAELLRALNAEAAEWVENENPGCPKTMAVYDILLRKSKRKVKTHDVVNEINEACGTRFDSNLHGKWRRGERPVPREVEALMRRHILSCLYGEEGEVLASLLDGDGFCEPE